MMMKIFKIDFRKSFSRFFLVILVVSLTSCEKYLDVVPDYVATLDDAFSLRINAERYLYNCYSYMPRNGDPNYNIGFLAADEIWFNQRSFGGIAPFVVSRGFQTRVDPYFNAWTGTRGASPGDRYGLFRAIRECNTFIENVSDYSKVPDLLAFDRERWLAEVKFLKAYYHFYLLRMYGPIPIIYENLPISASEEEVQLPRDPVDECVDYIVELLDEAILVLPAEILSPRTELGRITSPIAHALKAKVLLMAASPLFNGNTDMAGLVDDEGNPLFNQEVSTEKWQRAATATLEAITAAEAAGIRLYSFVNTSEKPLSDTIIQELSLRQAVCERGSAEVIWPNTNTRSSAETNDIQFLCVAPVTKEVDTRDAKKVFGAPLKIARMFYTKNGVPIEEDKTLDFTRENGPRVATADERYYLEEGETTARLNFDREPRFYSSLGFDRGMWYLKNEQEEGTYVLHALYGEYSGSTHTFLFNETGYYIKKLVDYNITFKTTNTTQSIVRYAWPEMRLAELYLSYAEALNEAGGSQADVLEYVDRVRARAGLDGVEASWVSFSSNPAKFTTVEGRRAIIHRERLIELAFEGHRYWDLLRWKKANVEFNQPITGWFTKGEDYTSYYQVVTLWNKEFVAPRDYFWPIAEQDLLENPSLIQNVGW